LYGFIVNVLRNDIKKLIRYPSPPKYAVSGVVGYIKGKSAIAIARTYLGKRQNFTGQNFWARGYYVSTVGRDEQAIRKYIQEQEAEDKRQDQMELFKDGE
jgi:putative transposase